MTQQGPSAPQREYDQFHCPHILRTVVILAIRQPNQIPEGPSRPQTQNTQRQKAPRASRSE